MLCPRTKKLFYHPLPKAGACVSAYHPHVRERLSFLTTLIFQAPLPTPIQPPRPRPPERCPTTWSARMTKESCRVRMLLFAAIDQARTARAVPFLLFLWLSF